ncbi:hypothetical protein AWB67_07248 [Caballeronia terrestris]|uniref:Uncharacterized protein n=1 Tax=Caballeronia terrestris TaxID=1226301 RepID=A0A158KZV4_9BURK|nr:hypothetical protein AWB67_07248 [Caballeronia terrestris]
MTITMVALVPLYLDVIRIKAGFDRCLLDLMRGRKSPNFAYLFLTDKQPSAP